MDVLDRVGHSHEPAARIAQIQLTCPHCEQTTDAFIAESMASTARVKCLRCGEAFDFTPGMLYNPVAYVTAVPDGAELAE